MWREHIFATFLQPIDPRNFSDLTPSNAWHFVVHFVTLYSELFLGFAALGLCLVLLDEAFSHRPSNPQDRVSPARKLVNLLVFAVVAALAVKIMLFLPLDLHPVDLTGKTYLVTGCTMGGIGFDTALILAEWNATVVCSVRTKAKGEEVVLRAAPALKGSKGKIEYGLVDFASFASVAAFSKEILKRVPQLDGLVLNAGANYMGSTITEDGLEQMVQVNHYSQFLLARLLEERLLSSSVAPKLVFVSSTGYLFGSVDRQVYESSKRPQGHQLPASWINTHSGLFTYSDTKLFNILTANKFAERFERKGLNATSNALCPGLVLTMIWDKAFERSLLEPFWPLLSSIGRTPRQGAARTIQILTEPSLAKVSGRFFHSYVPLPLTNQVNQRNQDWLWKQSNALLEKFGVKDD